MDKSFFFLFNNEKPSSQHNIHNIAVIQQLGKKMERGILWLNYGKDGGRGDV